MANSYFFYKFIHDDKSSYKKQHAAVKVLANLLSDIKMSDEVN